MSIAVKLRRGTTTQHGSFTGLLGEVTVDTDKDTLVVHDGATAGGFPLLKASEYTAADVLAKLLTVDGPGSGLDADTLDGLSSAAFATASHTHAAADITSGVLGTARLGTGTADNTVFLRGDGTWAAPSASVSDGDKGDITVSSGVWSIDAGVVTLAKVQNIAANSILGNNTGGAATAVELTAAQVRTLINVANGATANSSDSTLLDRANHTGTQAASTISDLTESVQDIIGALILDSTTLDATYNDGANTYALELQAAYNPVGKHLVPLPAAAFMPASTNPCADLAQAETATNKVNFKYLAFDGTNREYAIFSFPAPKCWNESTVTARLRWHAASGSGDVIWGVQGVALGDGDTLDSAWGTAQEVTDNAPNATTHRITAETSAITIAGTPAEGDTIYIRVYRKADDANDTLNAIDAFLTHVDLFLTTNAASDT